MLAVLIRFAISMREKAIVTPVKSREASVVPWSSRSLGLSAIQNVLAECGDNRGIAEGHI